MTLTGTEILILMEDERQSDPRPIDVDHIAAKLVKHLRINGTLTKDYEYAENTFRRYLIEAVREDRSSRRLHDAMHP